MNALDKLLGFLSPTFKSTMPVDLGRVETELSDEQKKLIGQEEKKPGIESIRVNITEDPEKKEEPKKQTGLATLPTKRDIFNEIFIDDNIRNINIIQRF